MGGRPNWNPSYWKHLDRESARKMRTACPKCGSDLTYYNKRFRVWRCGKCEHSWVIEGMGERRPWWRRLFGRR